MMLLEMLSQTTFISKPEFIPSSLPLDPNWIAG